MNQDSKDAWVEVAVQVHSEAAEAVAAMLMELGAGGVVYDDPRLLARRRQELGDDLIDEPGVEKKSIQREEAAELTVKAYLSPQQATPDVLAHLAERVRNLTKFGLNPGPVAVSARSVEEEDWAHAWKQYYKPVRAGRHIVIVPSWEEYHSRKSDVCITMDPGMAFGTGTHPTTQMCLAALEEKVRPGMRVLDLGTGSGVLAIAAAKLGAEVTAVDIDARAAQVAAENVERNGMAAKVHVKPGTLSVIPAGSQYDIIVANIVAVVIIQLLPEIGARLAAKGTFVASGIVDERLDEVRSAWSATELDLEEVRRMGDWACLVGGGVSCDASS